MANTDLDALGPRLRTFRTARGLTLGDVSTSTGTSVSTLSRLESGTRKPTLELLLPLARTYGVTLDELVDAPETGDPRVHAKAVTTPWGTVLPLTRRPGGVRAYKMVLRPRRRSVPDPQQHEGYEWLYVLDGRLRLVLGGRDLTLRAGEVVEFDTRTPHWFGCADDRPVELLSLFGPQGERLHATTRPEPPESPSHK